MAHMREVEAELKLRCADVPWTVSWSLIDLFTGESVSYDANLPVLSASVRKVAIMMTLLQKVNEGRFSLDQEVISYKSDLLGGGTLKELQPPFRLKLIDHVRLMIILSDNCSSSHCLDMASVDRVNRFCASIGMVNTIHRRKGDGQTFYAQPWWSLDLDNQTSAADQSLLLRLIVEGSNNADTARHLGVTPALCLLALEVMCQQMLTTRIPYHLPPGVRVASKGGTGAYNYNDIGVIYDGDKPRLVWSIFTSQVPPELNDLPSRAVVSDFIAKLSRYVYDARIGAQAMKGGAM